MTGLIILIVIAAIIGLWVAAGYNRFIRLRNRCQNGMAQIDVQLKRRYDLIPNLVETVKGYAKHEKETFQNVTDARAGAIAAGSVGEQAKAENMLTQALRSVFAVAENYPELKANTNFLQLQEELGETEDKIRYARQFYNDIVMRFNTALQVFPNVILARIFNFGVEEYFELDDTPDQREAPQVKF
ncbi:LemA family protein [Candidatus Zixiibacteriota bacterium]